MSDALLAAAFARLDAIHAEDPDVRSIDGRAIPAELLYAERMSAMLAKVRPDASVALRLAVRAQHLARFRMPRANFPDGRPGYLRWRTEQAKRHAELAAEVLGEVGFDAATCARVVELVRKKGLPNDVETQALEDCACLVFLAYELDAFAAKEARADVVRILRKTWPKMSPAAHAIALAFSYSDLGKQRVDEALGASDER